MAGLVATSAAEINASLIKFLPELADSDYARYPMKHDRWYDPTETAPNGEPCYVAIGNGKQQSQSLPDLKKGYVFCRKTPEGMEPGYFSLMCRISYVNLYEKIDSVRPPMPGCCGIGGDPDDRIVFDQWDDVKLVIWSRQLAAKPDDDFAGKAAMDVAKGKADSVYKFTQNEQVVVNAATTVAFVAAG